MIRGVSGDYNGRDISDLEDSCGTKI